LCHKWKGTAPRSQCGEHPHRRWLAMFLCSINVAFALLPR
jgi:hypothetical protein